MQYMWLFLLGSKDYHDRLGYVVTTCPDCSVRGAFTVLQERKKVTVYLVPTFQYSKKQFMACPTCGEVFEVAPELKSELEKKMISRDEFVEKIKSGNIDKMLGKGRKPKSTKTAGCKTCGALVLAQMNYCPDCGNRIK